MKWRCPKCKFVWQGNMDTFYQVSIHEKSHAVTRSRKGKTNSAKQKSNQKLRNKLKKAARRSGKPISKESKVEKSKTKRRIVISQKRTATIKKSRY